MDVGSIFLLLAVAVITFLFVSRPFFEPGASQRLVVPTGAQQTEHERSALLAERDRVLNALLELDADHDLGKLQPDEYGRDRELLLKQGADTLRRLDEINLKDERPAAAAGGDDLEALIAARRQGKASVGSKVFCTRCGEALKPGDHFCASCGARVGS